MNRFKFYLFVLLMFALANNGFSQDVQFAQLFSDRMYLNPAFAGTDYCPRLSITYRNQWPGINFPFTTYSLTFDKQVEAINGGLGFRLMNDRQGNGVFNQLSADFIYAYQVNLSKKFSIRFAFEASVYQKSQNVDGLIFPDMINPVTGIVYPSSEIILPDKFLSPDFSTGLLVRYKNYFGGFSAIHIPQNLVEGHNDYLPLKIQAHIGAIIPIDKLDTKQERLVIEPNIVYISQQNRNVLYYGTYFDIRNMSFGLFCRQNLGFHFDALVASFHLKLNALNIGYSYDITLSRFYKHTLGAHEISLGYIFSCDKKIRNYNTISCPSF